MNMKQRKISMTEKTQALQPKFYLVSSDQTLCITHRMKLGRTTGDFVLNDNKLSSLHCEFSPQLLNLYIKDLKSTNGVFVNKQKIFPDSQYKLESGDRLLIGSSEYILYDNDEDARIAEILSKENGDDLSKSSNQLLVRNKAFKKEWFALYAMLLISTLVSFVFNLQLEIPVPKSLDLLSELYGDLIFFKGLKGILTVAGICTFHAVVLKYTAISRFYQIVVAAILLASFFFLMNLQLGPVWYVKQYLISRTIVMKENTNVTAIIRLKELIEAENDLNVSYKRIINKLSYEESKVLEKDYQELRELISVKKAHVT